jgi:molybdenum cofactor cytidylyltransferase
LSKRVSAIVLAAGAATRFGRAKQVASLGGRPLVEMVLDSLRQAGLSQVILVLGSRAAAVRRGLDLRGVTVVVNRDFKSGMSSSLKAGLGAISEEADAVLVALADQPLVPPYHIRRIVEAFEKTGDDVISSDLGDQIAPPILFARSVFPEMERLRGDRGAKTVALNHKGLLKVKPKDPRMLMDIDTEQDLAEANRVFREVRRVRGGGRPRPSRP